MNLEAGPRLAHAQVHPLKAVWLSNIEKTQRERNLGVRIPMKRIECLSSITLMLSILLLHGCIFEEIVGERTYSNDKYGVSITCPKGWKVRERHNGYSSRCGLVRFYRPSLFSEPATIFLRTIDRENRGSDPDSALRAAYRSLEVYQRHWGGFHLTVGPTEAVINNLEFVEIEYTSHNHSVNECYFNHNGELFRVSLHTKAQGLETCKNALYEVLASLKTDL
jgi:hypothetical protein